MDTGTTLLMAACGHGDLVDTVDEILRHGASVNQRDSQGLTALAWAVGIDRDRFDIQNEKRGLEVIKRLLQAVRIQRSDHTIICTVQVAPLLRQLWPGLPLSSCCSNCMQLLMTRHSTMQQSLPQPQESRAHCMQDSSRFMRCSTKRALHAMRMHGATMAYGTSRQRFYEWKALLNGRQQRLSDMFSASVPVAHAVLLECI